MKYSSMKNFFLDPRDDGGEERPEPMEDTKKIKVGSRLTTEHEGRRKRLLKQNLDLFAWIVKDVPEIDPDFISHKLAINPGAKPMVQVRRRMGEEKDKAMHVKTKNLLVVHFIQEIQYPISLANVAMVKRQMENGAYARTTPV